MVDTVFLSLILGLATGVSGLAWTGSPSDNVTLPACPNQNVSLTWGYTLTPDEDIVNTEWKHSTDGTHEVVIATEVNGRFYADPGSNGRVEYIPNAGVRLLNVEGADSGVYSVHIVVNRAGTVESHVRRVRVIVTDEPISPDNQLHAHVQGAQLMTPSQEHQLLLTCGDVSDLWGPRVTVVWITPSGQTLPTTFSSNGVYTLAVPNPVLSGQYTCKVDNSSQAANCIPSDSSLFDVGASVVVDGTQARMTLMDSQLTSLKDTVTSLSSERDQLASQAQQLLNNNSDVLQQINQLRSDNSKLKQDIASIAQGPVDMGCDFETGLCDYVQDHSDNFDWVRNSGTTGSSNTGPSVDHTTNSNHGYYLYTEGSSPRRPGDRATLFSREQCPSTMDICVSFYYHMYGNTMGTLSLRVSNSTRRSQPLFTKTGNQGDTWHQATVDIPADYLVGPYKLAFEGTTGSGYYTDMAIDDISVHLGQCA